MDQSRFNKKYIVT